MTSILLQTVCRAARNLTPALAWTAALGVGGGLIGVAPAQAGRRDEKDKATYTLKRVYKAGDVDRYRIGFKMKVESPEMPVEMAQTMVMKETTKEATDDGASTVITEFEHGTVTTDGMEVDISTMLPKIITTRDKNGKADIKTEGGEAADALDGMGDQMKQFTDFATLVLPKKPVKVGDTWEVSATGLGPPDTNAKGKGTLVSVETVKGLKVGKIKVVVDMVDEMNNKVRADTLLLIDIATGKTLDLISKIAGDSPDGKVSMEMTTRMLGPNEKGDGKEAFKADATFAKP